jgi:hypothetical protein
MFQVYSKESLRRKRNNLKMIIPLFGAKNLQVASFSA